MIPARAQELLLRFHVSRESWPALEAYVALLERWRSRINLIGPGTGDDIWIRHIVDGLQIIPLIRPGTRGFADLGTGAGIPGLPLALATGLAGHLYESNQKKLAFLREAIRMTGASCQLHGGRIEALTPADIPAEIGLVVSRALAPLTELLDLARPFLIRGCQALFHKGQHIDRELTEATKCWKLDHVIHPSAIDSAGVILEVKEATHVRR
ncbi:MAG: 16S rRNA (guanine(527)-N(7))-methyltransferase RsmG [Alphaproteobacteria bacterium]|nr:16S rRNA (guanine(527)-N(7))-methyltransferase RsmG [Alphaproteobacteria bacterium]